ncbi:hypothetical protein [Isoptericola sp. NPDC056605]|uniref:hypothetical protein n=1 Tax=Isoptericola sp. NPDC056605 TaxID=3345876 RepID=UPI003698853F
MSTHRHFLDKSCQVVVTARRGSTLARSYETDSVFVEVQVAPLDAVMIEGPLPKPSFDKGAYHVELGPGWGGLAADPAKGDLPLGQAAYHRTAARAHAALAESLERHEAQVERAVATMTRSLSGAHPIATVSADDVRTVLRAAIEAGVRFEGATS